MNTSIQLPSHRYLDDLYRAHHRWLYQWLCTKMNNPHDAADISHDAFIKLIQQQTEKPQTYLQPRAMLSTVAKNLALNFWRRKHIERVFYENLTQIHSEYSASIEDEYLMIERLCKLHQAFNQLNPREKQVFRLSRVEGLNYQEIAMQLNVSLTTVKRDMKQALLCCMTVLQSD